MWELRQKVEAIPEETVAFIHLWCSYCDIFVRTEEGVRDLLNALKQSEKIPSPYVRRMYDEIRIYLKGAVEPSLSIEFMLPGAETFLGMRFLEALEREEERQAAEFRKFFRQLTKVRAIEVDGNRVESSEEIASLLSLLSHVNRHCVAMTRTERDKRVRIEIWSIHDSLTERPSTILRLLFPRKEFGVKREEILPDAFWKFCPRLANQYDTIQTND